jgi:diaminopimelate epimerase
MRLRFTKMQGAGNDFVVLDGTRGSVELTPEQIQKLGDRRFGVGADQILMVERSSTPGIDFGYRIFNGGSGDEVEHCGNGARCFVRFVNEHGLSIKRTLRVQTMNNTLELRLQDDGRVTVDMNTPVFDLARVPFDASGLSARELGGFARRSGCASTSAAPARPSPAAPAPAPRSSPASGSGCSMRASMSRRVVAA